jgi:tetratricopeptide (TPR) repeat protein
MLKSLIKKSPVVLLSLGLLSCTAVMTNNVDRVDHGSIQLDTRINPEKDPRAYYHFLRAYSAEMDNEEELALKEYRSALRYDNKSALLLTSTASLLMRRGDMAGATTYIQSALRLEPDNITTLMFLAGLYSSRGQYREAIQIYDRVIKLDPTQTEAYLTEGSLYANQEKFDQAISVIKKGIETDPTSPLGF